MVEPPRSRAGVVLVPEVHELPSLFLPDPARAQRAGRLAAWLLRERPDVPCDLGAGATTVLETAAALRAAGCERALVVTASHVGDADGERFLQRTLEHVLQPAGLGVEMIAADEEPLALLAARLGPRGPAAPPPPAVPLLLFEASDEPPAALAGFEHAADGLWLRCGRGRPGTVPARVRRLRIHEVGPAVPALHETELLALSGWADDVRATIEAARTAGPERVRLVGRPHSSAEWRTLRELVAAAFPARSLELDVVLGWRAQAVRPMHELLAGYGLRECNARLVENLAP